MPPGKIAKQGSSRWFNTTIGEFAEAVYDAALEEYMDEIIARRITMQMLVRKLRMQAKLVDVMAEKPKPAQKKVILRSELNKRREKRR